MWGEGKRYVWSNRLHIITNYTQTHDPEIKSSSSKTSDGCRVNAKDIVVATNAPIIDNTTSKIYDKQEPHRCM